MSRRDVAAAAAAEEMVAIKKAVSDGWHREPRVSVKNNKWRSLRQSLSAAFIASKSRKHPDSWQSVSSVYKASHKWLRFSPSCCLSFFGCWVGGVETMTGNLLVFLEKISSLGTIILLLSSVSESTYCTFLSCRCEQSVFFHIQITTVPITFPQHVPSDLRFGWLRFKISQLFLFTCRKTRVTVYHSSFKQTLICIPSDVAHPA